MLWESIVEESCDIAMDCTSFQTQHPTPTLGRGSRRANVDDTLHEMAIDELSFYGEESSSSQGQQEPQQHCYRRSRPSAGVLNPLLPEGSPQRFEIIEKLAAHKSVSQALGPHQQKLQNATCTSTSTTSSNPAEPNFRMFHSLSSGSMESSIDDEYMELFEMESLEQQEGPSSLNMNFPSNLNSLISGQIKSSSPSVGDNVSVKTPELRRPSVRRCLSMTENYQQLQPKTPELLKKVQETATSTTPFSSKVTAERSGNTSSTTLFNGGFKRPDPPTAGSPILTKRYRGDEKENVNTAAPFTIRSAKGLGEQGQGRPLLRKCMSMNDAEIMTALARSESKGEPDLIGDFSKPFALPLMDGRHRDLKSITSDTVARLIQGEFHDQVANFKIVDCRYPYEYEGGHIRGAENIYTQEQILEEFLSQQKTEVQLERTEAAGKKRNILIFHCEFSSERGPKLSRFLRNNDRVRNTSSYPALDYPEIYLLHNGYKEFYETHSELCDPIAYTPMLEPAYNEAYRHFRAKSKSWNGDGTGGTTSRTKKSRSRLML